MSLRVDHLLFGCATVLTAATIASAAQAQQRQFNIPAGEATKTVPEFGRQAGIQVSAPTADLKGVRTNAVRGRLDVGEAVRRLLDGTGLGASSTSSVLIVRTLTASVAPSDTTAGEAEAESATAESELLEEVVVTGTRTQTQFAPALATAVVTREENERLGRTSVEEALRSEPAFTSVTSNPTPALVGQGAGSGSTASAQLRGLPTLTLLNGRRVASSGFISAQGSSENFVDLSSIPFAAIERVEILKGGGSAMYGTDAVGGIVNYILRRNFNGVEASLTAGVTGEADGEFVRPSIVAGYANDSTSLLVAVDYEDRSRVRAVDRDFSSTANFESRGGAFKLAPFGLPTNILRLDTFQLVPGGTCDILFDDGTPPDRTDGPPPLCYTDLNKFVDLAPDRRRFGGLVAGSIKLGAAEFFSQITYARSEFTINTPPVVDIGFQALLPPGDPRNPFAVPILLPFGFAATTEANQLRGDNEAYRVLGGIRSVVGEVDVEATISYAKSSNGFSFRDAFSQSGVAALVASGRFNPVDPRLTPGVIDEAQIEQSFRGDSSILAADVLARGRLLALPGGDLSYAFGAEIREEKVDAAPSEAWRLGQVFGFPGYPAVKGERTNHAAYGEVVAPLTDKLTAQLALRYDSYEGVGDTLNPQISLVYEATRYLTLRGAYGTGFRAPSLSQLSFTSPNQRQGGFDPLRCPTTDDPLDCQGPFEVTFDSTGLKPESTEQFNIGVDLRPLPSLRMKLDYWNIEYTDRIDLLSIFSVLGDPELEPGRVVRGPSQDGLPGRVQAIRTGFVNLSKVKLDGLDGSIVWTPNVGPGQLNLDLSGVYFLSYNNFSPFSQYDDPEVLGEYYGSGPRLRANLTGTYRVSEWAGTAQVTYIDDYFVAPGGLIVITQPLTFRERGDRIDSLTTLDLSLSYTGIANTTLVFGVRNVFNEDPPFDPDSQLGFDTRIHDPFGRSFFASARYRF